MLNSNAVAIYAAVLMPGDAGYLFVVPLHIWIFFVSLYMYIRYCAYEEFGILILIPKTLFFVCVKFDSKFQHRHVWRWLRRLREIRLRTFPPHKLSAGVSGSRCAARLDFGLDLTRHLQHSDDITKQMNCLEG